MTLRCIECLKPLTPETMVRLTQQAAMCAACHAEAMEACQAESQATGAHQVTFLPDPAELHRRVELMRAAIGNAPRPDGHGMGDAPPGTAFYEPQPRRVAGWRRRRERTGAA